MKPGTVTRIALLIAVALSTGAVHGPYAENYVLVVFRDGVSRTRDNLAITPAELRAFREAKTVADRIMATPHYTNDGATNTTLAELGVDRSERLFQRIKPMNQKTGLNFSNAYGLHVTLASVPQAVAALRHLQSVVYASPNWDVSPMRRPIR
ncbi:MAG: hypothetical protein M3Z14_01270 [Candidatus Eremiobacteraeota bacterium]|nr:hypothetical protein [Candidatus Eremiobacteraeota bacterium]